MESADLTSHAHVLSPAEQTAFSDQLLSETATRFPLRRPVTVAWRNYRTTAGTAQYHTNTICLSMHLLTHEEALRSTFLHEYAHLLAFDRHGKRGTGHGVAWQIAMRDLGQPPSVRHNYSCKRNVARQEVVLRCAKCGCEIIRSRMLPKRRKFYHVGCGGRIEFVRRQPKTNITELP